MKKRILIIASILMALAIILDAMGAHLLESYLSAKELANFRTGTKYHVIHSLSIFIIISLSYRLHTKMLYFACYFLIGGIILFSGSLYSLSLLNAINLTKFKSLFVPATPIGGFMFITGWVFAMIGFIKGKAKKSSLT